MIKRFFSWLRGTPTTAETSSSANTEFCAEVVRVTEILPHPNADRLEMIRFEMKGTGPSSYEVISQKGTYLAGSLACYFSVDCLLPLSHEAFAFLKQPGSKKEIHRLRAARLRGTFSQGLLVPAPKGAGYGDPVAERYGVTYHSPDIEEPVVHLDKCKKPRSQPMPIYGVESLKKVPRLFDEGEPVLVTEKIHGSNFRAAWVRKRFLGIPVGWKFVVGSHRVIKTGSGKDWYGEDLWNDVARIYKIAEKTRRVPGHIFYGEVYGLTSSGKKIQDLTYGQVGPALAFFDIKAPNGWMGSDERMAWLRFLDLPCVPVVNTCSWSGYVIEEAEGQSLIDLNQIREGIVVESTAPGVRKKAKYVGKTYLMRKES